MSEGVDSDVELAAIAAGDGDAFARWLARAEGPLRRSLRRFASAVDTEAVLQEALLRVWQVAGRCVPDGQPHGLLRLAVRITRNLAISAGRRHHKDSAAGQSEGRSGQFSSANEPAHEPTPETTHEPTIEPANVPDANVRAAVAACRDKLPSKPRAAIDARIGTDGSDDDHALAARLSMRTNTFLQNVTRARRLLAECLRRSGIDLDLEMA